VNSLPKTVTRQRRDCDLNPGPSAPESIKLTTRLPSHASITKLNKSAAVQCNVLQTCEKNIGISAHFTHLRKFRNFVFATEVTTFSDHNPLMYLRECAPKSAKLTRWALGLQEFMHADSNIFSHVCMILFSEYTHCIK